MYTIEDFIKVIMEFIEFFENITILERKKLKAATENDILSIEKYMQAEEAETLKIRGLERKQEKIQAALSWDGLSFKEIVRKAPEEYKPRMSELYDKLSASVKMYKAVFESANSVINANLHSINVKLEEMSENKAGVSGEYNKKGETKRSFGFTDIKA